MRNKAFYMGPKLHSQAPEISRNSTGSFWHVVTLAKKKSTMCESTIGPVAELNSCSHTRGNPGPYHGVCFSSSISWIPILRRRINERVELGSTTMSTTPSTFLTKDSRKLSLENPRQGPQILERSIFPLILLRS